MLKKIIFIFAIMCAAAFGVAAQQETEPVKTATPPVSQETSTNEETDEPVVPEKDRYRLQPSDVIDVRYVYSPEYDRKGVVVQPDGFVSLELVGNIHVAGLTINQVREKIRRRAAERLNEPEVLVILTDFVKPYIVVAGEVPTPGKMELRDSTTVLQAVLLAGGFKDTAKASQVILFRRYNAELVETKIINLKDLKRDAKVRDDITLQSGDMIFIPRNTITKLERYARLASVVSIFGFLIP